MPGLFGWIDKPKDHSRGRESPESKDAWDRVSRNLTDRQNEVLEVVRARGFLGATVHEVAAAMSTTPNAVSGRLSELRAMEKIKKTGARRQGAAVLVACDRLVAGTTECAGA